MNLSLYFHLPKKESRFQILPTISLVPLFLNLSIPHHCHLPTVPTPLYQLVTSPCLDLEQSTSTRTCGCRGQASTRNTAEVLSPRANIPMSFLRSQVRLGLGQRDCTVES